MSIKNTIQRNPRFWERTQGQLIISMLALGIIPLIIMGTMAYINAQEALRVRVKDQLESLVSIKADRVIDHLERWAGIVAATSGFGSIAGDDNPETYNGVTDIMTYRNVGDSQNRYDIAYDYALTALQAMVDGFGELHVLAITSAMGEVIVSTDNTALAEGTSLANQPEFVNGLKGAFMGTTNRDGEVKMLFSHPVTDTRGRTVGVIVAHVDLTLLWPIMQNNVGLGETGETYLVDATTKTLLSPSRFEGRDAIVNETAITTDAVEETIAQQKTFTGEYTDYRDVTVLGSTARIDELGWIVVGELDTNEAYAAINSLLQIVLLVGSIAAIIILVVAYLIARSISRPIRQLTDAATRIANTQQNEYVDIKSRNEVGLLASAFNTMTENLQVMMETERKSKANLENMVTKYTDFVRRVAEGDLTQRLALQSHATESTEDDLYQLGVNLNAMVEGLSGMAQQIREAAAGVASAAAEILAATTQQIASSTEQDAAVTQTMTTVEEVRTTVKQTSERAQNVAESSRQSVEISRLGQDSVSDSIQGMSQLRQRVESIAENILMLSERTQQIGEIIDTVNEIANQSKLLALNASIEAARAGEEGKGFAVVAMEVRQLAEQSREATARVRDILNQIQQATNTAVMVTEEGSKGAENGMSLVERAGEAIRDLTQTIDVAAQAAIQIAASTHQQTNGMDQLASAMSAIKQATMQTAASTRQAERSAQDLNTMASEMQKAVARYRLN